MTDLEIIKKFKPIIYRKASFYSAISISINGISDFDDFVSIGMAAAIDAYKSLDLSKAGLVTRAFSMIDFKMKKELNGMHFYSLAHYNYVTRYFKALRELGEDASDTQIIEWSKNIHKHQSTRLTECNLPFIKRLITYKQFSTDSNINDIKNELNPIKYEIPDQGESLENIMINSEHSRMLYEEIDKLPIKPKTVLLMRLHDHTLEEVGLHFKLTRERIRQIEAKYLLIITRRIERKLSI